jgi:hypothetical protein
MMKNNFPKIKHRSRKDTALIPQVLDRGVNTIKNIYRFIDRTVFNPKGHDCTANTITIARLYLFIILGYAITFDLSGVHDQVSSSRVQLEKVYWDFNSQ